MTTTALLGTVVALVFIALALVIFTFVVRALSRPSRRSPPSQPSAAGIDPAPADTSLPAVTAAVLPEHAHVHAIRVIRRLPAERLAVGQVVDVQEPAFHRHVLVVA